MPRGQHIRYQCQRCANFCKWPGDVLITDAETDAIAAFLGQEAADFIEGRKFKTLTFC